MTLDISNWLDLNILEGHTDLGATTSYFDSPGKFSNKFEEFKNSEARPRKIQGYIDEKEEEKVIDEEDEDETEVQKKIRNMQRENKMIMGK